MCPESQAHLAERTASVGEKGTIREFQRHGGGERFTMYGIGNCAVCLPDQSGVVFSNLPLNIQHRVGTNDQVLAVLTNGAMYESVFKFPNGAEALLTELKGAHFRVGPVVDDIDREWSVIFREVEQKMAIETPVLVGAARTVAGRALVGGGAVALFLMAVLR